MRDIILGLTCTPRVGWKSIEQIISVINEKKLVNIFDISSSDWQDLCPFLREEQSLSLSKNMTKERMAERKDILQRKNISFTTIMEEAYPSALKEVYSAPWILFFRGNIDLLSLPLLAFVGARKISAYGKTVVQGLIPELVGCGWGIVSGLALGIDAQSHLTALQAKGKTIAILGSGIDQVYPPQHRKLYDDIVEEGLVMSEYPPLTRAHPSYFPQRNRIISGISLGVIVIEAAKKSGSLITAHTALEQGREVFAIPGTIYSPASVGTNLLIQQGAKMVTDVKDILEEFPYIQNVDVIEKNSHRGVNKGNIAEDIEKEILDLFTDEKMEMNQLLSSTSLSFAFLSTHLLKLEMKGYIKKFPGNYYQLVKQIKKE